MIKRIIVALVTSLTMLVPVSVFSASPANAGVCVQKHISAENWVRAYGGGQYIFRPNMYWHACGDRAIFDKYVVQISRANGDCGEVRSWRVNPNIIGNYNPGEQTRYCQDDDAVDVMTWNPEYGKTIYPSDPANEKCLGAHVTIDINNWPDQHYDLTSLCVSFY